MTAPPSSSSSPSIGALLGSRAGHLAMAVLVVELLAGMQVYLNQTVLPLLATEMDARNTYGLVTAAAQVPSFLTMPLGGAMLTRWRPARLMTALTVLLVVGAVVGALAPNIEVYVLGEILRGLAAGAMATGVAIIGALRASSPWFWPGVAGGTTLVLWSCSRVLPAGTLCLAVGRRAGIATLMWVCAFFLTLDYLVAPSAHDVLDMTPTQIGWALTAGGIGWSVVALVCGAHPAREPKVYRRRTTLAAAFVAPTASGVETDRLWPTLILLAVGLLLTPLLARRAARAGGWPHAPAGSTIAPMWILRMR